jgi:hypothetical protein
MRTMTTDPVWFANTTAVIAAAISGAAFGAAALSAWYARQQAHAARRQARTNEDAVRLQAEALRGQASDTAKALEIAHQSAAALRAQADDTHAALEIAKQSADAAERLAEANEALATTGQRGWLVVFTNSGSADHHWEIHKKAVIRCVLVFKNIGKTAITDVRIRYCQKVAEVEPTDYYPQNVDRYSTLPPHSDIPLNDSFDCDRATWERLNAREARLYFYGNAIYMDIFGKLRTTQWCFEFTNNELHPCERGNRLE